MTLQEWKILQNIKSLGELAKKLKVADTTNPARLVHRWIKGEAFPTQKNLALIFKATNGKVTPTDFLTQ
ncbi:hypothetical protein CMI47_05915 [Candidatus Pacearchaeota archaeon]|jgi:hypothetical protein|nr:hypothetical protein [Candidatus Pacearchaeota archaeon]|tara:strand:- start:250 stop:456 length:207 start_codon:yes stop_codon:yes gene_type:complete